MAAVGFSHVVSMSVQSGSINIQSDGTYTGSGNPRIDDDAPASGTKQMNIAIDVSAVKSIIMLSDQDVTIKTNSSGSPTDTIALAAGIAYVWNEDSLDTLKLTGDVTTIYVVNATTSDARVRIDVIQDATP